MVSNLHLFRLSRAMSHHANEVVLDSSQNLTHIHAAHRKADYLLTRTPDNVIMNQTVSPNYQHGLCLFSRTLSD